MIGAYMPFENQYRNRTPTDFLTKLVDKYNNTTPFRIFCRNCECHEHLAIPTLLNSSPGYQKPSLR